MRRFPLLIGLLALAGCGSSEQRVNVPRPAPPVTMTAAVHDDLIRISPAAVGAGQVTFIVSNQSAKPQKVTVETDELGGTRGGNTASSPTIPAGATGRVTINVREGNYSVHVADHSVRAARLIVGPPRKSGQNALLLP
jgi:hypothetical protein